MSKDIPQVGPLQWGRINRHPRHQDGLAVLALLGPGDELVAPAHDLADVRKADQLELADDLLDPLRLPGGPPLPLDVGWGARDEFA